MAEDSIREVGSVSVLNSRSTEDGGHLHGETCLSISPNKEGFNSSDHLNTECSLLGDTVSNEPATECPGQLSTQRIPIDYANADVSESTKNSSESEFTTADKENCIPAVVTTCGPGVTGPVHVATEAPHKESLSQKSEEAGSALPLTPGRQIEDDAEVVRRAREEGRVNVVFPGSVTQEGCCRIICEILKCILYQRQQLPMTYEQLVYSQKEHQDMLNKELVGRRPSLSTVLDWRRCQRTLQDLEEVLQQLEVLFSLSLVPRVLLLLGGSIILPKELYEVNMEAVLRASGGRSLRVSTCMRHMFRTLFVADVLSDTRPIHLMNTTIMVMAHRDCGVDWFRPKLEYRVPTRVKSQVIALASDPGFSEASQRDLQAWQDYVWFQAPVAIKGFSK
ncbi:MAD2L1-binding protein [Hypomesus transpacificus]|uniref:MAD2L1-binding protein n=1 Tax=Hypomesus transpacificus TaxID=137520 RepID=UPI001F084BD7|nr:MAD2L1-binding protein [Hypomesus transpacificus]